MISGKIILKSSTKLSLDRRFGEIAKQAPATPPPAPRFQQQANVTIPYSRDELFGNKRRPDIPQRNRPTTVNIAQRLKKRSINYRLGLGNNAGGNFGNRQNANQGPPRVLQRIGFGGRRRGASSYVFGGQSGMGVRLRGEGRVGTRIFRSKTRGYLNNNAISRFSRGRNNNNRNNINRQNNQPQRGRGTGSTRGVRGRLSGRGGNNTVRGRGGRNARGGRNNKNPVTKEGLDDDIQQYMARTNLDTDSFEMSAV